MKKIVILGGGTAGWLTALYAKHLFDKAEVTLVESSEIGILGAGEGSVPMMPLFLQTLQIPLGEFKREAHATFKTGIRFTNWKGDGTSYLHPFLAPPGNTLDFKAIHSLGFNHASKIPNTNSAYYIVNALANKENLEEVIPVNALVNNMKSPFYNLENKVQSSSGYSFHFNARKAAVYLAKIGEGRGIKRVDSKLKQINSKEDGTITSIELKNGQVLDLDFIFDCSGFNRLIIGNFYKTEWISYKKYLTTDSAVPFFVPHKEKVLRPETNCVAMKYGWMWQIPVKHRWGMGYSFDSNYITPEQAYDEIEEVLGHPIERLGKVFQFNAGSYKDVWVKNCMAIGLSSGFVEPLEATSLMIALMQLVNLDPSLMSENNQEDLDQYNKAIAGLNHEVMCFLYYHFYTNREDTPFWKNYKDKVNVPPGLDKLLKLWERRTPKNLDLHELTGGEVFDIYSWYIVGAGNGTLNMDHIEKENKLLDLDNKLKPFRDTLRSHLKEVINSSIDNIQVHHGD